MARWVPFFVAVAILTVVLLVLARRSQELIRTAESAEEPAGDVVPREESPEELSPLEREEIPHPEREAGRDPASVPAQDPGESSPRAPRREMELTPAVLLANVALTQGVVAVVVVAAGWYFSIPADAFGLTGDPSSTGLPAVALGVAFGVVLWIGNEFSTAAADAVGASYDEGIREMLAPDSPRGWVVLFALVLPIIAVSEELLFRAALIGVPAAGFGVSQWPLAVVSSLAFALGHGAQGRVGIVVTGLLGLVLAAGYVVTGSLLVVIVAHYVINGLEFFVHEYAGIEGVIPGFDGAAG